LLALLHCLYISCMTTIAFYNLKGGVGKTAATINLAYLAAAEGKKTLVWDLDPQGSSSFYLGAKGVLNDTKKLLNDGTDLASLAQNTAYENLDIVPADMSARTMDVLLNEFKQSKKRLKTLIGALKNSYDLVILDCPPGLSLLHENVFTAADWVMMPNIPSTLSIRSYESVVAFFKENGLDKSAIKCFFSMVDHRKNLHHEVMNDFYKDKLFFKSYIPYLSDVEKMGTHEAPVMKFANSSYASQCYRDLWKEMKKTIF
jgi:chromosome partitioning protein